MNKIKKMRLPVELQQLQKTQKEHGETAIAINSNGYILCPTGITCTAAADDYSQLIAHIPGPKGSPYEEGKFKVGIAIGVQYPFRPPTFKFLTPVYHPNIDTSGKICLDLLRMPPSGSYNPAITLESILLSIQLLLATPNPDDPLRGDVADLYKTRRSLFDRLARDAVRKHCLEKTTDAERVAVGEGGEMQLAEHMPASGENAEVAGAVKPQS